MKDAMVTAKIAVADAVYYFDRVYEYRIPEEYASAAVPGVRVVVPFGQGNKHREGLILRVSPQRSERELKQILRVLDPEPVLSEEMISLAVWMRNRYFCTIYDAVHAILPAGLWYMLEAGYSLCEGMDRETAYAAAEGYDDETTVLDAVFAHGGVCPEEDLRRLFDGSLPGKAISSLKRKGVIAPDSRGKKRAKDKSVRMISLCAPMEEARQYAAAREKRAPMQSAVVRLLCVLERASVAEVRGFTGASAKSVDAVIRAGIAEYSDEELFRRPKYTAAEDAPLPVLNEEQNAAYEGIMSLFRRGEASASLLYGVTGSGKTAVYIRLIHSVLQEGKSVILLVPEIALTPQMIRVFSAHFGREIAVLHSSLPVGERYDEWKRIRKGDARVVIGTRSAVFAPAADLGMIIIDEEHEYSYKSGNEPRYHALDVAKYRCASRGAPLVLGSATPDIVSMYHAVCGRYSLFTLKKRFNERKLPTVEIVDMREELKSGNGGELSGRLRQELRKNLDRGEQSILFLNRRGTNSLVTCMDCGFTYECPRCSVKLIWHGHRRRLMCHHCGYSRSADAACPECGGEIGFFGTGTQNVEDQLREALPDAEILRMDADSVSADNNHEKILSRFREERIPVLIGTQMVTKGLDFENVTLVGVLSADQMLYSSDYHASERCFSLITQVVGRSGRGEKPGRALIQTFTPGNAIIRFAAKQDYDSFYRSELEIRRLQNCPPFSEIVTLTVTSPQESRTIACCADLRDTLSEELRHREDVTILGPAPLPVVRVMDVFRYRLTLQCTFDREIREIVSRALIFFNSEKRYRGISVYADLDPME